MMENYHRKKREAEEEERKRLFKLVEHQYQYKGEHYAQTPQEGADEKEKGGGRQKRPTYEPLKDHSQLDGEWIDRKRSNTVNSNGMLLHFHSRPISSYQHSKSIFRRSSIIIFFFQFQTNSVGDCTSLHNSTITIVQEIQWCHHTVYKLDII